MTTQTRRRWLVWTLYLALALAFCWPLFEHPQALGAMDWDQHHFYYGSFLRNVVDYAQLPLWNPWYCGGDVQWQNPQIALLSPVYPMTAVMSLQLAMKVNVVLHYVVGLVGMDLLLTEAIGLTSLPLVVYLAAVFAFQGAIALHLGVGHSNFLPALYLPWEFFFVLRSIQRRSVRDALAGGAVMALMIYNGGLHAVPMAIVGIGVFSVAAAVGQKDWRPIALALLVGVSSGAFAAPKLLPVVSYVSSDRFWDTRIDVEHPDRMTSDMMFRAYVDGYQGRRLQMGPPQRHPWHEYGNYIGALAAILVLAGMTWTLCVDRGADRRTRVALAITALLLLTLSAGEFAAWAPGSIAAHLPLFSQFRIPSRYTIPFLLFGLMTVAAVLRSLIGDGTTLSRPAVAFVTLVCVFAVGDLVRINRTQFAGVFSMAPPPAGMVPLHHSPVLVTEHTSTPYTNDSPMFRSLMAGNSVFNCYESLQLTHSSDPDNPIVYSDGKSQIVRTAFSPNRIEFSAIGGAVASQVYLNQNYAPGWSSTLGPVTPEPGTNRPTVTLGPGQTGKFVFVFFPPGLAAGCVVLLVSLAAAAFVWTRRPTL